ncbi:MAG TPA: hypothetical protein VGQ09_08115 [Chitinophagaceae bacterium]|jgi:hypothetical protein|nr:hypothetical protein [Chitinophagaceae bacterium]
MQLKLMIFFGGLSFLVYSNNLYAQEENPTNIVERVSNKIFTSIEKKTSQVEQRLNRQTEKYLSKLQKQENKLRKKLQKKDSTLAKQLFDKTAGEYDKLKNLPANLNKYNAIYSGHLDSLSTALNFLKNENLQNLSLNPELQKALDHCKSLQQKLNQTDQIKKFLTERRRMLREQLEKFGMVKELKKFQKQVYYYKAQMEEYKKMFEDPSKLETKLMELVLKLPQFKKFFANNSMLASLFPNMSNVNTSAAVIGLQPRAMVNQYLTTRFGGTANYNQVLQRNIQSAQGEVDELRNKLRSLTNGNYGNSGDFDMPDFKPNDQKTKSFFQRLEYGTNLQTAHGTYYFPITTDLGLSLGYKLSDKNIIGIGASYKVGWGKDIRHIDVSSEGAGFRSFLDINIKKTYFLSGGFEYNYQKPFSSFQQINYLKDWQQSGLIGMSKIVSLKTKVFKKTKIQLLWDFLSYQQRPQAQAFKFRIGYNF